MIKTVLRNLITNAIKFTPENGTITLRVIENDNDVEVMVEDTGVGIDPNKVKTIFNEGFQQSTKGTSGEVGTGIGLMLCKEFVERNNGSISVKSQIDKGSCFIFKLPKHNTKK